MKHQSSKHSQPAEQPNPRIQGKASTNTMRDKPLVTILLCICYCLPLANAILSHLLWQPLPLRMTVFVVVFTLLWTVVTYSRRTFAISSISAAGLVLLFIIIRYLTGDLRSTISDIWDWIVAFLDEMWWESIPLVNYGAFLTGLVTAIITLYAVICSKKPHMLALGLLGVGIYCWEWFYGFHNNVPLLALFLATMAGLYIKKAHIRLYYRARIDRNSKIYPLAVFPLCLVLAAVSVVMSAILPQRQPINVIEQWDMMQLDSVADFWAAIRAPSEFQFYRTGFSDRDGKIGGDISLNKAPVLEVHTDIAGGPLYLAGSYRDTYQNNSWKNTIEQNIVENYHQLKDKEKQHWLMKSGYLQLEQVRSVTIQPIHRQKVLFAPQNCLSITADFSFIRKPSDALSAEQSFKSAYVAAYHSNDGIQAVQIPLSDYRQDYYKQYAVVGDLSYYNQEYEELSKYADSIRRHYLQLPKDLPERVKGLAKTITANYEGKGDVLKAWAIMQYLSNYEYTLKPGPVPKGRDLVDYFLFDHKQGYCTYYATAMVVLCRTLGIPARYVEGYAVDSLSSHTIVTNEQAHTWVEVYLEGYGWYVMDPTAVSRSSTGRPTPPIATTTTAPTQDATPSTIQTPETTMTSPTAATPTTSPPAPIDKLYWIYPLMGAVLAVSTICTAPYVLRKRRLKKLNGAPPAERMEGYFALLLELLQKDGVEISSSETALSLGKRLDKQYTFDGIGLYQIACLYCRYAYSDISDISNEQANKDGNTIRQYYHALYQQVKRNLGLAWIFHVYFRCR